MSHETPYRHPCPPDVPRPSWTYRYAWAIALLAVILMIAAAVICVAYPRRFVVSTCFGVIGVAGARFLQFVFRSVYDRFRRFP